MTAIAAALMSMIGVGGAGTAQAATLKPAALGNCGSLAAANDRLCILADGSSNPDFYWVLLHVYTGSDGHDHAWGQAYGAPNSQVYLDISHDNGQTWTGWQNQNRNTSGVWNIFSTNSTPDGPGTWVRAGGLGDRNQFLVTGWN